jgi:hypothetical protein
MAAIWRLCILPVLPFDFEMTANEMTDLLNDLQERAGNAFDLGPAIQGAEVLKGKAKQLKEKSEHIARQLKALTPEAFDETLNAKAVALDECIMKLSRIIIPMNYSATDRFDMDLAIAIPPFARLQPVSDLSALDSDSNEFKFLERKMVRERNRVCHALIEAAELIDQTLSTLTLEFP